MFEMCVEFRTHSGHIPDTFSLPIVHNTAILNARKGGGHVGEMLYGSD